VKGSIRRGRGAGLALLLALAPALASASEPASAGGSGKSKATKSAKSKTPPKDAHESGPDLFGGYSYTHAGEASLNGWELSGSFPLRGRLRIAADLAGHYGSFAGADLKQVNLLAGPRMAWRMGRLTPFAQLLLGVVKDTTEVVAADTTLKDSATHFGTTLGGGADYRLGRRWAVRGQVELLFQSAEGAWDTDPRLAVGAVYRF
jgi:opacity protein-like surface antigen